MHLLRPRSATVKMETILSGFAVMIIVTNSKEDISPKAQEWRQTEYRGVTGRCQDCLIHHNAIILETWEGRGGFAAECRFMAFPSKRVGRLCVCSYGQNNGGYTVPLQPALEGEGGLVVKDPLKNGFPLKDQFPCKNRRVGKFTNYCVA